VWLWVGFVVFLCVLNRRFVCWFVTAVVCCLDTRGWGHKERVYRTWLGVEECLFLLIMWFAIVACV